MAGNSTTENSKRHDPPLESSRERRGFWAVTAIAASVVAVYLARELLLFVAAALILSCALNPVVRALQGWRFPRLVAVLAVMLGFLGLVGLVGTKMVSPLVAWFESPPQEFERLGDFISELRAEMEKVDQASEALGNGDNRGDGKVVVDVAEPSVTELVVSEAPGVLGITAAIVILLYFLLVYGDLLVLKLVEASPHLREKKKVVEVVREMERAVSRYLMTVTAINFCLGLAVGGSLALLDFENAWIWGTVAMILNYVPYVGAIIGVTLLGVVSVVNYDSLGQALLFPGIYAAFTALEGNFVTPTILGRSFSLNPIFIILALLFFGWLWGAVGTLLAVPLLVIFKSTIAQTGHHRWADALGR